MHNRRAEGPPAARIASGGVAVPCAGRAAMVSSCRAGPRRTAT
ncbi:hypothetical protein F750_5164 [Streptomyces sp. PAMC 26508]|nr:hypothetical protein F750_5164 [Streptomyces sp. PAMC 26508]